MDYLGSCCSVFVVALVALIALIALVRGYNLLVALREHVEAAWHQIDVQLTRRHDLIPNLIKIAERYGVVETTALKRILQARYAAMGATQMGDRAHAEGVLHQTASKLIVVMESYPNLKSDQHYAALQSRWADTENMIASARASYNNAVREYNSTLSQFPHICIGAMFLLPKANYFEADHPRKSTVPSF